MMNHTREWLGVGALIWLVVGGGIEFAIERLAPHFVQEYFSTLWIFCGWAGPSLALAMMGLRKGNPASRICSILVLIALALPLLFIIYLGVQLGRCVAEPAGRGGIKPANQRNVILRACSIMRG
jgi:hypothetical protein